MKSNLVSIAAALSLSLLPLHTVSAQTDDPVSRIEASCKNAVWSLYDCTCMANKFIASGAEETEANLTDFFFQETHSGKTECINRSESALKGAENYCKNVMEYPSQRAGFDCGCWAKEYLAGWEKNPYQSTGNRSQLVSNALLACGW